MDPNEPMKPREILKYEVQFWKDAIKKLRQEKTSFRQQYEQLRKDIQNNLENPENPIIRNQLQSLDRRLSSHSSYLSNGYAQTFIYEELESGERHIVHTSLNHASLGMHNLFSAAHPLSLALKEALGEAEYNDWPIDFHFKDKDWLLLQVCDINYYQPDLYDFLSLASNVADEENQWVFYNEDGLRLLFNPNVEVPNAPVGEIREDVQAESPQNIENKNEESSLSEKWYNSVLSSQLGILRQAPDGVTVITGVAGSGKTSVALLRPALLCEGFRDENDNVIHEALDPQRCAGFVRTTQLKSYLETSIKESDSVLLRNIKIEAYDEVRQKLGIRYHLPHLAMNCEDTLETILGSRRFQIILNPFLIDKIYQKLHTICKVLLSIHEKSPLESIDEERDTTNVLRGFIRKYNTTRWLKKVHKHSSSLRVNSKSWRLFLKGTQKDLTDSLQKESVSREEKKNIRIAKRLMKNVASNVTEIEEFLFKNKDLLSNRTSNPAIKRYFEVQPNKDYVLLMILLIDSYKDVMRTKKIWEGLERWIEQLDKVTIQKQKDLLQQRAKNKRILSNSDTDVLLYQLFTLLASDRDNPSFGRTRNLEHLLIDEFQDFSWVQLKLIKALLPDNISMTLVGDFQQSLSYSGVHSIKEIKSIFPRVLEHHLDKNMRQSKQLCEFSSLYRLLIQQDAKTIYGKKSEGAPPTKIQNADIIETVLSWKRENPYKTVCIILPTEEEANDFYEENRGIIQGAFQTASLSTEIHSYLHKRQPIHICTSKPTKGLEFDAVVCVNIDNYTLSDTVQRDMLYVAISRPKTKLWVSLAKPATGVLKKFLEKSNLK